jgi:hypothetical protein
MCMWFGEETNLDSSDARFEAADLNWGRVDEEATWFCSDAMADVAGQLGFRSTACRSAFGKQAHTSTLGRVQSLHRYRV